MMTSCSASPGPCGPDVSPLPCQAHAAPSRAKRAVSERLTFSISPGEARIEGQRSRPGGADQPGCREADRASRLLACTCQPCPKGSLARSCRRGAGSALIQQAIAQVLMPVCFPVSGIVVRVPSRPARPSGGAVARRIQDGPGRHVPLAPGGWTRPGCQTGAGGRLTRRDTAGGEKRDANDQCEDGGQRQHLARSGDAGTGVLGRISHRRAVGGT